MARYRALVANRQTAEVRGFTLPAGFSFRTSDREFAEQLAANFPDSLRRLGSRIEVLQPLVLFAPIS